MTTEELQQAIIEGQKELVRELEKELNRIRKSNLKIRMHMQVLVSHPAIRTSRMIQEKYTLPGIPARELLTTSVN